MLPQDAINLIDHPAFKKQTPQTWADLGCGSGVFTQALAALLPTGSTIYAVDKAKTLDKNIAAFPTSIIFTQQDFEQDNLDLPPLDGVLMANALHYVQNKQVFLQRLSTWCKPAAAFLLVEYDIAIPVPRWVPYPLPFHQCAGLFGAAGFGHVIRLNERPSAFGRGLLYSALAKKQLTYNP